MSHPDEDPDDDDAGPTPMHEKSSNRAYREKGHSKNEETAKEAKALKRH